MRDLRVQEFLRELIVGVPALSDLMGSILVKILHCGEGGDVEKVARISKQILPCLRLLISLSTHLCLISYLHLLLHLYMLDIYLCLIVIYAWDCLISCMLVFLAYSLHA